MTDLNECVKALTDTFSYEVFWRAQEEAKLAEAEAKMDAEMVPQSTKRNVNLDFEGQQMLGWKQLIESEKKKIDQPDTEQVNIQDDSYFEIEVEAQGEYAEIIEQQLEDGQ